MALWVFSRMRKGGSHYTSRIVRISKVFLLAVNENSKMYSWNVLKSIYSTICDDSLLRYAQTASYYLECCKTFVKMVEMFSLCLYRLGLCVSGSFSNSLIFRSPTRASHSMVSRSDSVKIGVWCMI